MEASIKRRMLRIRAMSRLSRMKGWHGVIPTELVQEYRVLAGLLKGAAG